MGSCNIRDIERADFREVRADIRSETEEHRVAERQQPDVADQQIEGEREQRKAQTFIRKTG